MTFKKLLGWTLLVSSSWLLFAWLLAQVVPLPQRMQQRDSTVLSYRDGSPAHIFLSPDEQWRIGARPDEVDERYIEALLAYEDKRFYFHPGVDPISIVRAAMSNLAAGEVVSGASTLTMQVVRILEPRPRTFRSKIIEALRAVQFELRMSKAEILATYLRFAPFGRNIEGVSAASWAYFGHGPAELSAMEAIYLVTAPQDPNKRYPKATHTGRVRRVLIGATERLQEEGLLSDAEAQEIAEDPLPNALRPFPRNAPHAAAWLRQRQPEAQHVATTLDRGTQGTAERVLASYREELAAMGIHNAAAVVIDVDTGRVRGLVGNLDFWDNAHHGQVVGFLGERSPGSTLKPFIYAMAIDRGQLLPDYLVQDVPVRFGPYEPHNYDERFRGLVRAEQALATSLNVPFVNMLKRVGVTDFLSFLQAGGVTTVDADANRYGLAAAIGGLEMNLLELTNLYAQLGRQGAALPWQVLQGDESQMPRQVLSPGAVFLTRRALALRDRPDFPSRRSAVQMAPDIFWKTGTSYGHRDAWAVGGNGRFAVGIWLGNFDGTASHALVGGERAGPVLFDILDALSNRRVEQPRRFAPADLVDVEICAYSGHLPSPACPHRKTVLAPQRNLPVETCGMHVEALVDDATGHRLCPLCSGGRPHTAHTFTVLPTGVRRWISDRQLLGQQLPSHLPSCSHVADSAPPRIAKPVANAVVYLLPDVPVTRQQLPLEVDANGRTGEVHWFVNGKLYHSGDAAERIWLAPQLGEIEIRVVDAAGRGDAVRIRVQEI